MSRQNADRWHLPGLLRLEVVVGIPSLSGTCEHGLTPVAGGHTNTGPRSSRPGGF